MTLVSYNNTDVMGNFNIVKLKAVALAIYSTFHYRVTFLLQ